MTRLGLFSRQAGESAGGVEASAKSYSAVHTATRRYGRIDQCFTERRKAIRKPLWLRMGAQCQCGAAGSLVSVMQEDKGTLAVVPLAVDRHKVCRKNDEMVGLHQTSPFAGLSGSHIGHVGDLMP